MKQQRHASSRRAFIDVMYPQRATGIHVHNLEIPRNKRKIRDVSKGGLRSTQYLHESAP
jgi:hypothetical protein